MAENSKIEWTDHTVNLWWGCSKVHAGCKNCYAESLSNRFGGDLWGNDRPRKVIKSSFNMLNKYEQIGRSSGVLQKVFVGSMMDIFEESKKTIGGDSLYNTAAYRNMLFNFIYQGRYDNIVFLFLTKRPENIPNMLHLGLRDRRNVWFGTSVSDQKTVWYADKLREYRHSNLFLSIEPQVGRISEIDLSGIKWVIQGGESGRNKRPFELDWAYEMRDICRQAGVPYFFKQIDKVQQIPDDLLNREFPLFYKKQD